MLDNKQGYWRDKEPIVILEPEMNCQYHLTLCVWMWWYTILIIKLSWHGYNTYPDRCLTSCEHYWLSWSHHFERFTIATMTWLTVTKYLCHKWRRICSTSQPWHSWYITGLVIRVSRQVAQMEQELLHLS